MTENVAFRENLLCVFLIDIPSRNAHSFIFCHGFWPTLHLLFSLFAPMMLINLGAKAKEQIPTRSQKHTPKNKAANPQQKVNNKAA